MEDEDMLGDEMGSDTAALAASYPDLAAMGPADMRRALLSKYLGAVESERTAREQSAASQAARFKAAEEAINQQRFGAPTTSQQLAALSQALLSPRRQRGIAGTFANLAPVFGQMATLQTGAEEKRAEALRQLREQTALAREQALVSGAESQRKSFGELMRVYGPQSAMGQWSESLQRFIPKDRAVPVASGKLPDGRRVDKLSDGSMRALNNDGSYSYYDAGGNPINVGGQ